MDQPAETAAQRQSARLLAAAALAAQMAHAQDASVKQENPSADMPAPADPAPSVDAVATTSSPAPVPTIGSRAFVDLALREFLRQAATSESSEPLSPALAAYALEALTEGPTALTEFVPSALNKLQAEAQAAAEPQTQPLPARVHLPLPDRFTGVRSDLTRFELAVERYVQSMDVHKSVMNLIPSLLAEHALTWYNGQAKDGNLPSTWEAFKVLLHRRFADPAAVQKARDKLDSLTHSGTVAQLRGAFESCLLNIPTMSVEDRIDRFVRKLRWDIRYEVILRHPKTLEELYCLAEEVELADNARQRNKPRAAEDADGQAGRGRRGQGRGRQQEGAFSPGRGNPNNNGQNAQGGGFGYRYNQPVALANMQTAGAQSNSAAVENNQPTQGEQSFNAMHPRHQGRNPMPQADVDRCFAEHRCYWCKQDNRISVSPHQAKFCPVKMRGDPPNPMPAPTAQVQNVRQSGNDQGHRRQ